MRRTITLLIILIIPCLLISQFKLGPGTRLSFQIMRSTIGNVGNGVWVVRGGFDVNKNGKKEILLYTDSTFYVSHATYNSIHLLENDGPDSYKQIWSTFLPYPANSFGDIAVADVDKDGLNEIWIDVPTAVTDDNPNPPRLYCYEFDGTKIPTQPTASWSLEGREKMDIRPSSMVIEDIDNDGEIEIILATRKDAYGDQSTTGRSLIIGSMITQIDPGGLNVFVREYIDTNSYLRGGNIYDMKVVDFDGDGKKEIWVMTWNKYTLNIYEVTGPNTYQHLTEIRAPIEHSDIGSTMGTHFYDVNKDGKLEGFVSGAQGSGIGEVLYLEPVTDVSKFGKSNIKELGYRGNNDPRGSAIGDFDKDGKMDFVLMDRKNKRIVRMEYKGSGDPSDSLSYDWSTILTDTMSVFPGDYYLMSGSATDMDGDGLPEIMAAAINIKDESRPLVLVLELTGVDAVPNINIENKLDFQLKQNYPNPFNPTTKIDFVLNKADFIKLKIYNILGQEIKTLINEYKQIGNYSIDFSSEGLPSGSYYYSLSTEKSATRMKMLLVK